MGEALRQQSLRVPGSSSNLGVFQVTERPDNTHKTVLRIPSDAPTPTFEPLPGTFCITVTGTLSRRSDVELLEPSGVNPGKGTYRDIGFIAANVAGTNPGLFGVQGSSGIRSSSRYPNCTARMSKANRWIPSRPNANRIIPCSSRRVVSARTLTRRQIIGLNPSSRTLNCRISSAPSTEAFTAPSSTSAGKSPLAGSDFHARVNKR